jgi:flagellin
MPSVSILGFSNFAASLARSSLNSANEGHRRSLERLSSGSRVGVAGDEPVSLSLATRMRSDIRQQQATQSNTQNALSFLQVQEGILQGAAEILTRIAELSSMARDVTKSDSDLANFDAEFQQLQQQLLDLNSGSFNGISLFVEAPVGNTAASTTEELLELSLTADGKKIALSRPAMATNPWMNMLINGFVSFADPGNLSRRIFVPNPPQDVKGYLQDGTEFDLDQTVTITQRWTEQFSLTPGWNSRAATNLALNPITVAASVALPSASASGANTFRLNNPQSPYVTSPTYRALAENFRNNTLIDPLHAGTTTTSSINVTFSTAVPGATLDVPTESVTLTSTLQAWTDNPLAASAANVSTGTLDRNTASEISTVASLAVESLAKTMATNGAQQSRLGHSLDRQQLTTIGMEAAVSRVADVDVAAEVAQLSRFSMLQETASAMLTQANVSHQMVMRLLFN